jgi:2Fe-2S ferredoxin
MRQTMPTCAMAKIRFLKNKPEIDVESGANLMQSLLSAGRPVASSCYGKGICSKCRVKVISGAENLSRPNALEKLTRTNLSKTSSALSEDERLSCQCRLINNDVTIDTGYW